MNIISFGQTIYGLIAAIGIGVVVIVFWIYYYKMIEEDEKELEYKIHK